MSTISLFSGRWMRFSSRWILAAGLDGNLARGAEGAQDYQEFRSRRAIETIRPWPL
jgi:hypothetical protein